jgi:uncharacterized protein
MRTRGRQRLWSAALSLIWVGVGATACERGETEPGSTTPHEATSAARPKPEAAAELAPAELGRRCIVPLSETPPPSARRAEHCPSDPEDGTELPRGRVRFIDRASAPTVTVELARTDAHRGRGLMYRTAMADDAGMLFSWPDEKPRSFWMRNTCIPLDMLFIAADGTIVGVLEEVPTLDESPRRIPCPAAHVLEVNAGWVRANGIRPGQRVAIDP